MKLPVLCHEEVVEEIKDVHDIFQDDGSSAGDDLGLLVLHHRFDVVQRAEHLLHLSLKLVHILKTVTHYTMAGPGKKKTLQKTIQPFAEYGNASLTTFWVKKKKFKLDLEILSKYLTKLTNQK